MLQQPLPSMVDWNALPAGSKIKPAEGEKEREFERESKSSIKKSAFPYEAVKKGRERERDQDGKKSVGRKNVRLARYGSSCQGSHIALCNGNF